MSWRPVDDRPVTLRGLRMIHAFPASARRPVPRPRASAATRLLPAWALAAVLCWRALSAAVPAPAILLLDGATAGQDIVAVGERGTILRSVNHAASWQPVAPATRAALTALSLAPNGITGWAVGHDATILVTEDAGCSWRRQWQGENLEDSFLDVLALDDARVIAVGGYGLYLSSSDAGRSWSRQKISPDDHHLNRISRGPTGTLYLAGERGTLLRSTDQGRTWTPLVTDYEGSFFGVLPLDHRTLLAYGLRGHVFRSVDDGGTWTQVDIPQPVLLATALRLKSNDILLAGHARTLLVSRDLGQTFTPLPTAMATAIAELIELPDGSILALGEAGATVLPPP